MKGKRILSFLLTLVLVLGCVGSIPAKAAGNEMSVASVFNFSTSNGDWRFNFNMDGTWPTDGALDKYSETFSIEIKDASGNVLDTPVSDAISSYKNESYWMLCIWGTYTANNAPNDGDTITISDGQMAYADDASKVVTFSKECVLKWNATTSTWEIVIEVETVPGKLTLTSATTASTAWPGGTSASAIYLHSDDAITPYTDWSVISSPLNDGTSGIYLGETRIETGKLKKFSDGAWYAEGFGAVVAGDIVTIKGIFGNETTGEYVEMAETQFQWNGKYWEEYIVTPDETGKVFSRVSSDYNTATSVVLVGDDTLEAGTGWVPFIVGTDGGAGNGIYYNNTKTYIPLKRIGAGRYYVALGDVGITAVKNDILTVKGVFTNSYYSATYEEANFIFDGSTWSIEEPEVEYTDIKITEIESTNIGADSSGNPFWDLYFKTDADVPGENWATTYDDIVVMANDTQISASIKRANDAKQLNIFIWGSEFSTTPEVGTCLTIKAGKSSGYVISDGTSIGSGINLTEDFTVEWNGSAWALPAAPIVYTDFAISGISVSTQVKGSVWQAYFNTSEVLPGTAWGIVGGVAEKYTLDLEIDGEATTALVKKSNEKVLYLELPLDELPPDSAKMVTIKAGHYDSNAQSIGLHIAEDFTFYTNPYGWTTTADSYKDGMTFQLDTEAPNSKAAIGFVLTTNEDDGVTPDAEGWTSRIYPAYTKTVSEDGRLLSFGGENGVFKNGVYQAVDVPLVKIGTHNYYVALSDVDLTASAGDSYTVQGGFVDKTTGKFVKFEAITVQWNGEGWTTIASSLADTGVSYDVNADGAFNLKDLMRFGRYLQDGATPVNLTQMDISENGVVDAEDKLYLQHTMVGSIAHLPCAAEICDFVVDVESGREPVVLQLTDTQIIDASQQRSADRLSSVASEYWATDRVEECCYDYLTETINATNPDLILLTGDLVYGEFDDNGTAFTSLVNFMESFQIPWAPVFGNHEAETNLGIDVYCDQLEAAEYCLFKQRELTGNGNYSVGIRQDNEIKRVFFMLDSNGCGSVSSASLANGHTISSQGFGTDQIEWYTRTAKLIKTVSPATKLSFAFHIQLAVFEDAYAKYGFDSSNVTSSNILANPINIDRLADKAEGDFGYLGRGLKGPWDPNYSVWNGLKELGVDSIFVGHEHCNSASVVYEDVRFQYGQKSSTYDRANFIDETTGIITGDACSSTLTPLIGGTVMSLAADGSIVNPYIYLCENAGGKINWDEYDVVSE